MDPTGAWREVVQGLGTHVLRTNTRVQQSADSEYWLIAGDAATGTAARTAYVGT